MNLLRSFFATIILLSLWAFLQVEKVHSEQDDSFYKDFLVQRMMIARIREFRGDATAKSLLQSLVKEAKGIGMQTPEWSQTHTLKLSSKYNSHADKKMDSTIYAPLIHKASKRYNLPPALIKAVIHAESAFVKDAISKKGAQGLMQLMPDTAAEIGVHNAFDPRANIFGGSRLLRRYLDEFRSLKKTLIAYNAGPNWVRKRKGIPKETRIYIRRVINYYHTYKKEI